MQPIEILKTALARTSDEYVIISAGHLADACEAAMKAAPAPDATAQSLNRIARAAPSPGSRMQIPRGQATYLVKLLTEPEPPPATETLTP